MSDYEKTKTEEHVSGSFIYENKQVRPEVISIKSVQTDKPETIFMENEYYQIEVVIEVGDAQT
jgi:hypothetical protein